MELVTRPRIVCLGEGMLEERVGPDGALTTHYGGDTLNTAIHLTRLGCDSAFASAVGRDAESQALVRAWQGEGLDTAHVLRHPERTVGRYRIAVDAHGERSFSYDRSASAARDLFVFEDARRDLGRIPGAQGLVFSLISLAILPHQARQLLLELAEAVRAKGGLVVFDGNYRPALWESIEAARQWHSAAIRVSDIGLPTLEDEQALLGLVDAATVAAHWRALGCGEVVVKLGAAGCCLPDGTTLPPPETLSPVDTSGAGDAFNAGYLAARLTGSDPREAAQAGHRLAGWTIMRLGALPPRDAAYP